MNISAFECILKSQMKVWRGQAHLKVSAHNRNTPVEVWAIFQNEKLVFLSILTATWYWNVAALFNHHTELLLFSFLYFCTFTLHNSVQSSKNIIKLKFSIKSANSLTCIAIKHWLKTILIELYYSGLIILIWLVNS